MSQLYLILFFVASITVIFGACGPADDAFECRDFCDYYGVCDPSMSDSDWDLCHTECKSNAYSRTFVDCVTSHPCTDNPAQVQDDCLLEADELFEPPDPRTAPSKR